MRQAAEGRVVHLDQAARISRQHFAFSTLPDCTGSAGRRPAATRLDGVRLRRIGLARVEDAAEARRPPWDAPGNRHRTDVRQLQRRFVSQAENLDLRPPLPNIAG
ncbi:hypothetical protein [Rhodosalinus sp.]|uniref:hypothetical protein n=1 Tax=Rhodosalinus sp. TaxID=2047741 RepID=UPI00397B2795